MFKIGTVSKSHGTHGDVVIRSETGDTILSAELLYLQTREGDFLPVRVKKIRPAVKDSMFFVLFTEISSRNEAEEIRNLELFTTDESLIPEPEEPDMDDPLHAAFSCTGYKLLDENGEVAGIIDTAIDNPAHPLLVVQHASDDPAPEQFLVPFVNAYIVEIDDEAQTVTGTNIGSLREV